jgi:predicted lipase
MYDITYNEIIIALCLSMLIYNYNENEFFIIKDGQTLVDFLKSIDYHFDIYQRETLTFLCNKCPDGKIIKFIDNNDTDLQCALVTSDINKKLNIVFRGTDSITDCFYDSLFCKTFLELDDNVTIGIHTGFYKQFESIYDSIINIILEYIKKDYEIYITGHSLAHALSVLLSYHISDFTEKKIKIITFGGPKIGNYDWKINYESKKNLLLYRITNEADIVTTIPHFNYYHVGFHIHLTKNSIEFEDNNCIHNTSDHSIIHYYNNLFGKENIYNNLLKN